MDLVKLLPKENILHQDGRFNLINKEGVSYLQPVSEKEVQGITDLHKWEQAFEVYMAIYTEAHRKGHLKFINVSIA